MKNETDILNLISKIQVHLFALDQKMNTLISRSMPDAKLSPASSVAVPRVAARPNDHNKGRTMHEAICADCKKECRIPFKPSGDRPVYCQDCFSRRKVISLSGIKVDDKPKEAAIDVPKPQVKKKKKIATVKKSVTKKKSAPKKK